MRGYVPVPDRIGSIKQPAAAALRVVPVAEITIEPAVWAELPAFFPIAIAFTPCEELPAPPPIATAYVP